jgi:hypothetical protein
VVGLRATELFSLARPADLYGVFRMIYNVESGWSL